MKAIAKVQHDVVQQIAEESPEIKERFLYLLESFETNWPKLKERLHGDKDAGRSKDGLQLKIRSIYEMTCSYAKVTSEDVPGQLVYFVFAVTFRTVRHIAPLQEDTTLRGAYYKLKDIPPGSLFMTKDGTKAVKSEYYYGNNPDSQCQCVLLESGEYAHFENKNDELVKLLDPPGTRRIA